MANQVYFRGNSLMQELMEAAELLEKYSTDPSVSKADVVESMQDRVCTLMGKIIAMPTCTSMALYKTNVD